MGASDNPLKILFLTAEYEPFAKVGGLGDYSGSLPHAIRRVSEQSGLAVDIRVAMPFHGLFSSVARNIKKVVSLAVNTRRSIARGHASLFLHRGIPVYLISRGGNPSGYRAIYNPSQVQDARKYIFFSLACADLVRRLDWAPDIIHSNDWHTALAVVQFVRLRKQDKFFSSARTLQVIHNVPFLGQGSESVMREFNINSVNSGLIPDWGKNLPLPMSLVFADEISTVSPSYTEELALEEYGDGLAGFFIKNRQKTTGILNGIDTDMWDPQNDPELASNFSVESLEKRAENKRAVLAEFGFLNSLKKPLLILISRLTYQKGIDLLLQGLPRMLDREWNAVFLGTGQKEYESALQALQSAYPDKVRAVLQFDNSLAHRLYAAGDILLMPSLYEPCGLSQMIAMRYGCVPVARAVGGLKDSITREPAHRQTGYLFDSADDNAFIECLNHALDDYQDKERWVTIQKLGMKKDFSWDSSAIKYLELYQKMLAS